MTQPFTQNLNDVLGIGGVELKIRGKNLLHISLMFLSPDEFQK